MAYGNEEHVEYRSWDRWGLGSRLRSITCGAIVTTVLYLILNIELTDYNFPMNHSKPFWLDYEAVMLSGLK
jgi:hypothetical protein